MSLVDHFSSEAARLSASLPGAELPGLTAQREAALARFRREGLPTIRLEDWKYTSLASLERKPLPVAGAVTEAPPLQSLLDLAVLPQAIHRLVFLDGHFAPALSSASLPQGVHLGSMARAVAGTAGATAKLPGEPEQGSTLAALNLALSADGLSLVLDTGVTVSEPILVLFVGVQPDTSSFPASRIHLAAGAHATVVEQHVSLHQGAALNSVVLQITLAEGAQLQHIKVQHEPSRVVHVADTRAVIAAGARLRSLVLALGGQLAREDLQVSLDGAQAAVELDGLYLARNRRHLDHHTTVIHASPDCTSRQNYRGILDDAGRGVFNGRVIVARDAQHTDAQQSNANLLLSDSAEIDTKPQLEIFADDVRCSHGATVGQLDPAELFYLRSRGLDEAQARTLVTFAFAARSLSCVPADTPLYAGLHAQIAAHLPGGDQLESLTS